MKKFFTLMAVAIFSATSFAQVRSDIQTATLIHGDQTTVFYGADAFKSAYSSAANEGDIIVLSAGSFTNAADITKSITIYGVGYEQDPVSGGGLTSISSIVITDKEVYDDEGNMQYEYPVVRIEGLNCSLTVRASSTKSNAVLKNLVVRKCRMSSISLDSPSESCLLSQCVLYSLFGQGRLNLNYQLHSQLNVENCWLYSAEGSTLESTITYDHCIIHEVDIYATSNSPHYAHYTNNIMYGTPYSISTANYNVFLKTYTAGVGNWSNVSDTGLWEVDGETGNTYSATQTFALKFPKKYIGSDGTQVGLLGGKAPFDRISPIPRILESNIDINATEDGKLNVSLKVEAQTKE